MPAYVSIADNPKPVVVDSVKSETEKMKDSEMRGEDYRGEKTVANGDICATDVNGDGDGRDDGNGNGNDDVRRQHSLEINGVDDVNNVIKSDNLIEMKKKNTKENGSLSNYIPHHIFAKEPVHT